MIVDFTEIPKANSGDGDQDHFELFAEQFLEAIGMEIASGPGRGADGGKDLLVHEPLSGLVKDSSRLWLVSAKHHAHSGIAVSEKHESNMVDRVSKAHADGFLAFYSKVPTSALNDALQELENRTPPLAIATFHEAKIDRYLTTDRRLEPAFKSFFPKSYERFIASGGYPPDPEAHPPLPFISYVIELTPEVQASGKFQVTPMIEMHGDKPLTNASYYITESKYAHTLHNPVLTQSQRELTLPLGTRVAVNRFDLPIRDDDKLQIHALIASAEGTYVQETTVELKHGEPYFSTRLDIVSMNISLGERALVVTRTQTPQGVFQRVIHDERWQYLDEVQEFGRET